MRAIECSGGHHLAGVDHDHLELQRADEQLRERVAADAYDLVEA